MCENSMCFSHANGHMSILYIDYTKFFTNLFIRNFCPYCINSRVQVQTGLYSFLMLEIRSNTMSYSTKNGPLECAHYLFPVIMIHLNSLFLWKFINNILRFFMIKH